MIGVYLGGEGQNELGSYAGEPVYRAVSTYYPGIIETLLRRTQREGWEVTGALEWDKITKYRARGPSPREALNVLGLALDAVRAKAPVLAFLRDADADPDRVETINKAIDEARTKFPTLEIIGGCPFPLLEAWILAMKGVAQTESLSTSAAQRKLQEQGIPPKDTAGMVKAAKECDFDRLPKDAASLVSWRNTAKEVLPRLVQPRFRSVSSHDRRKHFLIAYEMTC